MLAAIAVLALSSPLGAPSYEIFRVEAVNGRVEQVYLAHTADLGTARDFVRYGRGEVAAYQLREVLP